MRSTNRKHDLFVYYGCAWVNNFYIECHSCVINFRPPLHFIDFPRVMLQIKPFQKLCPLQNLRPPPGRIKINDQEKNVPPQKNCHSPPPGLFLFINFEFSLTVTQGVTVAGIIQGLFIIGVKDISRISPDFSRLQSLSINTPLHRHLPHTDVDADN